MRSFLQLFLVALGFTTIDLFWVIKPAAEPTQRAAFHWSGDANALYLAVLFDVLIFTFLLLALLVLARKPGRLRIAIWTGLIFWLPWVCLMNTFVVSHLHLYYRRPSIVLFWGAFLATSWLVIRLRPAQTPLFERCISTAATLMLFAGLFGAFLLCRVSWYDWEVHSIEAQLALRHPQHSPTAQPHRVIWIVFDELAYRQLYEKRFPDLKMPAFDALAAQSTVFTNVIPEDTQTEIVLPALMTGKNTDDIRTSPTKQLLLHNGETHKWEQFDQHDTVFQDALDANYGTGVAGWYNPYCDILPSVLDECFWVSRMPISNVMVTNGRLADNMAAPLKYLRTFLLYAGPRSLQQRYMPYRFPGSGLNEKHDRQKDLSEIRDAADNLLGDPNVGFILIHLPIPHPPGIYNRQQGRISDSRSSYVNNLALADACLASVRQTLQASGQWDLATVVLMGDHAWRTTQIWAMGTVNLEWGQEDMDASEHGKYDPRPAYIVKLPGQTSGNRIDTPYHAVNTRKLFDGILNHTIQTPDQLTAWAQAAH